MLIIALQSIKPGFTLFNTLNLNTVIICYTMSSTNLQQTTLIETLEKKFACT